MKVKTYKIFDLEMWPANFPDEYTHLEGVHICQSIGDGWRMPIFNEFQLLSDFYIKGIGLFTNSSYWASNVFGDRGFCYRFDRKLGYYSDIDRKHAIRPVRKIQ